MRNPYAKSLHSKLFSEKSIPNKKKDYVPSETDFEEECYECRGTGIDPASDWDEDDQAFPSYDEACPVCDGQGYIPVWMFR